MVVETDSLKATSMIGKAGICLAMERIRMLVGESESCVVLGTGKQIWYHIVLPLLLRRVFNHF